METKELNGKAIYSPKGKAGEYAKYACKTYGTPLRTSTTTK